MKHSHLFKRLLILCFILSSFSVFSMNGYRAGRIFMVNGDTVTGLISYQSDAELATGCSFKQTKNGKARFYGTEELKGFQLDQEGRVFHKASLYLKYRYKSLFLETLVNGKISLYDWVDKTTGSTLFYLKKQGDTTLVDLPFEQTERLVDNGYTRLYKTICTTNHQDSLMKYMQDASALFPEIKKIVTPTPSNLAKLVSHYNETFASHDAQEASVAVSPKPKKDLGLSITPGVAYTNFMPNLYVQSYSMDGAFLSVCFTRRSKTVFFNAGYFQSFFSKYNGRSYWSSSYKRLEKIPVNVEYRLHLNHIQPRFCFGIDTYLTNGNVYCDVAPSLGLAIRINKLMAVSILSTYNFGPQDMSFDPSTEETKNPVITVFAGLQVSF